MCFFNQYYFSDTWFLFTVLIIKYWPLLGQTYKAYKYPNMISKTLHLPVHIMIYICLWHVKTFLIVHMLNHSLWDFTNAQAFFVSACEQSTSRKIKLVN